MECLILLTISCLTYRLFALLLCLNFRFDSLDFCISIVLFTRLNKYMEKIFICISQKSLVPLLPCLKVSLTQLPFSYSVT